MRASPLGTASARTMRAIASALALAVLTLGLSAESGASTASSLRAQLLTKNQLPRGWTIGVIGATTFNKALPAGRCASEPYVLATALEILNFNAKLSGSDNVTAFKDGVAGYNAWVVEYKRCYASIPSFHVHSLSIPRYGDTSIGFSQHLLPAFGDTQNYSDTVSVRKGNLVVDINLSDTSPISVPLLETFVATAVRDVH